MAIWTAKSHLVYKRGLREQLNSKKEKHFLQNKPLINNTKQMVLLADLIIRK